jgi:SAM-dependent methyltransferase
MAPSGTAQRASSFGSVAEAYDRYRPGPPLSAVEWILRSPCQTAADLGAGTGALTRVLATLAQRVVAVEPDARMLDVLTRRSPEASAVRSMAEQLPIRAGTLDAATVSSAWHWMDPDRTVAELGRVLRPGGVLGVIWNGADRSIDWVAELLGTRDPSPGDRRDRASRHRFELPSGSPFADLDSCTITWTKPMTREELVGLAGTYSSLITMPPDQRERELARIRAVTEAVVGGDVVEMPMGCRCWRAVRR